MKFRKQMEKGKLMRNQIVIVIGAGIAGLIAAEKLGAKGYKVIILEARRSIGGRVRISHFSSNSKNKFVIINIKRS